MKTLSWTNCSNLERIQHLLDLLGEEYDFPQTNILVQANVDQIATLDNSDRRALIRAASKNEASAFVVVDGLLHRKTTDKDGHPYFQIYYL